MRSPRSVIPNEFYSRVLAIPASKCLFMPTAEIALTADFARSRARAFFFPAARATSPRFILRGLSI